MKKIILAAFFMSASVMAEVPAEKLAKCAAIGGGLDRLKCYDYLAEEYTGIDPRVAATKPESAGKWVQSNGVNPLDDTIINSLILEADSGASRFNEPVTLVARCKSNKTELYINWGAYLGNEAIVTSRIATNKASTSRWDLSSDSQSTFKRQPISMLKEMLNETKLVVQITPYNENPSTAIFDITGLSQAIKPLRATCNW